MSVYYYDKKIHIKILFMLCIKTIYTLGKFATPRRSRYFCTMNIMKGKNFIKKVQAQFKKFDVFFIIYMYNIVRNVLDKFLYEIVKFIWKS